MDPDNMAIGKRLNCSCSPVSLSVQNQVAVVTFFPGYGLYVSLTTSIVPFGHTTGFEIRFNDGMSVPKPSEMAVTPMNKLKTKMTIRVAGLISSLQRSGCMQTAVCMLSNPNLGMKKAGRVTVFPANGLHAGGKRTQIFMTPRKPRAA